jgi:hypothetical protein
VATVSVIAGGLLIALVVLDVGLTVLHPAARGPISYRVNRATWRGVRGISLALLGGRLLSFAGPLAMAGNMLCWLAGLWLGYALVYAPFADDFSYTGAFGSTGFAEALYLSGVSLSTVGFGDVVAHTDGLRLVTVLEGASGLGAFTAAITYVLSVYPLLTEIRGDALRLADLGVERAEVAAQVASAGAPDELSHMAQALNRSHEHLKRFPILYYFESGNDEESLGALLRGSAVMCAVLRWGVSPDAVEVARLYGPAFDRSLDRIFDDLERDFIGGRRRKMDAGSPLPDDETRERIDLMRRKVAEREPDLACPPDAAAEGFAEFVGRADAVLGAFAEEHAQSRRRLFAPEHEPVVASSR